MSLRGLAIAAVAVGLGAAFPTVASAPPGWVIAGTAPTDYDFAVDTTTAASGKGSASITAKRGARSDGFGTLMQTIAADNYRGARWQLSGFLRTDAANRAQMWMRVDGSGGKVWGDDFRLEKTDAMVPVTAGGPMLPRVPANPDFEDSSQVIAVWEPRKVHFSAFILSCDRTHDLVTFVLLQLGARKSDLNVNVDQGQCGSGIGFAPAIDATFSVLTPSGAAGKNAGVLVEAQWQTVELKKTWDLDYLPANGDMCSLLEHVTKYVLPAFSTRNVKLIPRDFCERYRVGLRAEVLKPSQAAETSP
jgi:hypothetical protein